MSYMANMLRSMNLLFPHETAMTQPTPTFNVIELRRYTIREGRRDDFARYFETWFPEAFQQLGALALGQFTEPRVPDRFTWIRGFRDMDARAVANGAFYYGPVWKEHRQQLNELIIDSDDVLLLRPLDPGHAVPVLAAGTRTGRRAGRLGCPAVSAPAGQRRGVRACGGGCAGRVSRGRRGRCRHSGDPRRTE
jgi:hypothetical protein